MIPTSEDLTAAHEYAIKKMCTEIPSEFGANLTFWNDSDKTCRITQTGCNADLDWNPLSQRQYDQNGLYIDNKYTNNTRFKKIWNNSPPRDLSWKRLNDGSMGCGRTNFLYRNFCENPKSRSQAPVAGLTTGVPSFDYVIKDGVEYCQINNDYCKAKGISYSSSKEECYIPTGQKIAEMLTGTVMVRDIRSGSSSLSDKRLKTDIKIHKKDVLGKGVNVYTFKWNEIAQHLYSKPKLLDIGFLADELPPELTFYDEYGYKNIDLKSKSTGGTAVRLFYSIKNILRY